MPKILPPGYKYAEARVESFFWTFLASRITMHIFAKTYVLETGRNGPFFYFFRPCLRLIIVTMG